MSVCYKKLAVIFLHPHAIMLLSDATPLCHAWPKTCLRLTLDVSEDGSIIWGHEGGGNNNIQPMSVCYKNQENLTLFCLHSHAIMLLPNAIPPMP
jgi:hypothetical protein